MTAITTHFAPPDGTTRFSGSLIAAVFFTLVLLVLMQQLIATNFNAPAAVIPPKIQPVVLPKIQTVSEHRKKPELIEPVEPPPAIEPTHEPIENEFTFSDQPPVIQGPVTPTDQGKITFNNTSLIKQVAVSPIYPRRAVTRGVEGFVDVQFVVSASGATKDIRVINSAPKGYFEKAATAAVAKWKYLPRSVDGTSRDSTPITERIQFVLEN